VEYYIALSKTQQTWKTEDENVFPRITFFLGIIKEQAKQSINLIDWENINVYLSDKQNLVWNYIKENHPCTRKDIVMWTGLPEPTIKQIITKLINMWKITRIWQTRWIKYDIL